MKLKKINHPVFSLAIETKSNKIMLDIRKRNDDYLKRVVLKHRVMNPVQLIERGARLLCCSPQPDRIFPTNLEALNYVNENLINYL